MKITADLRQVMARFYENICRYTGEELPIDQLDIDHIIPKAKGGSDNLENYILASLSENRFSKRHLDLKPELQREILGLAKTNAPRILEQLKQERQKHGGNPTNPIAIKAFEFLGLTPKSRVATGRYLRSSEEPAPGVVYWATLSGNGLQFGVKLHKRGANYGPQLLRSDFLERGNLTFYRVIECEPLDEAALLKAKTDICNALE